MKPSSWNPENRFLLCFLGAAFVPFATISVYLWASRALQAGAGGDGGVLFTSMVLGIACIAGMPLRPLIRAVLGFLYALCLWHALLVYAVYFVVIVCGETI
jgi:hypothetical protein